MNIEEEIFKKSKFDENKLREYGFQKEKRNYQYSKKILDDAFSIDIVIDENFHIQGKIFEVGLNEEYTNFRVQDMSGNFVGIIRGEFIQLLKDIKKNCTIPCLFMFEQSNRIAKSIKENYNDDPIFQWDKFPGYAIFKNGTTNKWYGIIMNLSRSKLGENSSEEVEILDIKLEPEKIKKLLKRKGFYEAYHMNKKNWITVILDDTISDEELMGLLGESYFYSTTHK